MKDNIAPVITIDGPSGTGKGTICHLLANHLNWKVLDSGSIYRVLAFAAKKKHIPFDDIPNIVQLAHALDLRFETDAQLKSRALLDNKDVFDAIRTETCGQDASKIAVNPDIRNALLSRQRAFAEPPGLVTDGRDMGTVVFPNAFLKVYLFATDEVRAKRRYLQLKEKGFDVTLAQVVDELSKRDTRDSSRLCAPLKPAEDAIILDTSELSVEQVFARILKLLEGYTSSA